MVKRKVAELKGRGLDWLVAKAVYPRSVPAEDGKRFRVIDDDEELVGSVWVSGNEGWTAAWAPSTDWAQAGALIERLGITVEYALVGNGDWHAYVRNDEEHAGFYADSPLVAVCRAAVASVLGDEVEIPEGLTNA